MLIRGHSASAWAWLAIDTHGGAILLWSFVAAVALATWAAGLALTIEGLGVVLLLAVAACVALDLRDRGHSYPGQGY